MYDCLIIGGGVIGLSIAYELSNHGLRLAVLERARPGGEASWAGAGILPPANLETAHDPLEQLRGISHQCHARWAKLLVDQTGIDTGYRRCGGIYLARRAGEAAALRGWAALLQSQQITIEPLDANRVKAIEPALTPLADSRTLRAAYWVPDECQIRNPDHLRALVTACQQRGVELLSGQEATGIHLKGRYVTAVPTATEQLQAHRYCITTGAWTEALLRRLNISTGILPIRGQMLMLNCQPPVLKHILNEGPRYLVPRDDGRVLIGSTEEEVGFDKSTTPAAIADLHRLAIDLVPQLVSAQVERTWAGLRPATFDGLPYLGALPGLENVFVAAGHFRSGLHLSTGTAIVMSRLIRGEPPGIDLHPFRVARG